MKVFLFLSILFLSLDAKEQNIYELNCVSCHSKIAVSADKYFYRYLLKYSSETQVKKSMFEYLKNPQKEKSAMSESFISRFGIKKKSRLSDEKLKEAIDIYWEKYKIFGKIK